MEDAAYTLTLPCRSLQDLQSLVTAGYFGKTPNALRPLENLKVEEIRKELRLRKIYDFDGIKKDLQQQLDTILKGAQSVPTLLILNPTQSLSSLNLGEYTVLDCEPLHDIKGHLLNLFEGLPHILPAEIRVQCQELIETNLSRETVTGADIRMTAIHVLLLLINSSVHESLTLLLHTVVKISEILYSLYNQQSPKSILQLHNTTWLHHTLCQELFSKPKTTSCKKFFGLYLHSLSSHAAPQYEIMCLRSVNAEHQERLFGQARHIASSTSNRKPNNVIPTILLRLQARRDLGQLLPTFQATESQVQTASKAVPPFQCTKLPVSFIQKHTRSWQAHLVRISRYLLPGEGAWWKAEGENYIFTDSDSDPDFQPAGPPLLHFRSTCMNNLQQRKQSNWKRLLEEMVELPTPFIRLYDKAITLA